MCEGGIRKAGHCDQDPESCAERIGTLMAEVEIRRQVHEALFRFAADIDDLYQHAPCAYHVTDAGGVIRNINDTGLRWLGLARDAVVDRMRLADLVAPASRAPLEELFARLRSAGAAHNVELEMVRCDGSSFPVVAEAVADGTPPACRVVLHDIGERKAMERRRARRLRQLSRALVSVQEHERSRLSAELHARTSPNLAAIRINLDLIVSRLAPEAREELADRVEDTQALLADASSSVSDVCMDLRPCVLDYAGLLPALSCYTQQYSVRTGIRVRIESEEAEERLPADMESLFFRITQEALSNCARHARAESVDIRVDVRGGGASLVIRDDGIGFDAEELTRPGSTPGLGLIAMRERAEFAGGRFALESKPGGGTTIRVDV